MDISVVIPTLNKAGLLRRTLAALRAQRVRPGRRWEIVVVNDGSTDGTADLLAEQQAAEGVDLVVVAPAANQGRARARNLGVEAAHGRWVLFLDDDIVVPTGLLEGQLELLERHPGWGTIGKVATDPAIIDGPHFHYLDSRGVGRLGPGQAPSRYFVTQNAAVPRQAFLDVGGFDQEFGTYGFEDMEVAFRLEEQAGVRFLVLPWPVPRHVHHHSLREYWRKKVDCGRDSLPRLARKHPGRIAEMRLQPAVDGPGEPGLGALSRLVRRFASSGLLPWTAQRLGSWPAGRGHRPLAPWLYYGLMNLVVLGCYRRGVTGQPWLN